VQREDRETMFLSGGPRLETQLCFALYAASRATIDIYRPLLDELGITYPQYLVLLILWEHGSRSIKDIGHLLHLDSGTLSPLLKRLEAAGFIKRQRRVEDERVVDISLTAAGQALQERAASIPERFGCELGLTLDDYTGLLFRLKKLTEDLYAREARLISAPISVPQNEI
jgi:MarR family transcriptional regulator, organic hydroperoxide resistance regulator